MKDGLWDQLVWCTKYKPEEMPNFLETSVNQDIAVRSRDKLALRDFNCAFLDLTLRDLVLDKCDTKSAFLACQSTEKPAATIMVQNSRFFKLRIDANLKYFTVS